MKVNKIILSLCFVLFFVLLVWPIYVLLPYMLFSGIAKTIFIFAAISLEIIDGAFLLIWTLSNRKMLTKKQFYFSIIPIGFFFLAYLSSLFYVYVLQ